METVTPFKGSARVIQDGREMHVTFLSVLGPLPVEVIIEAIKSILVMLL